MALFVIDLSACELMASRQNSNLTASSNVKLVVANGKDKLNLKTAIVNITGELKLPPPTRSPYQLSITPVLGSDSRFGVTSKGVT